MAEISPALYRAGEGEPLVLLHGFTGAWRHWLPVLAELVPRFEVIAPTLHGHDGGPELARGGGSQTVSEGADHAEELLDSLGVDTAHFAGNSMGGALSLELAKRGRARSVVAISPGGGWRPGDKAEELRLTRWFARNQKLARAALPRAGQLMRRPGARRLALRDVMTHGDQMPAKEAVQLIRSSVRCTVVGDVLDTIRGGRALLTDLDKIDIPVLVTWGDCDRILPMDRHAQRFRDEIPGVEFRVTPGLGHTPMWDDPSLISSTIADWASAASKRPAAGETVAAVAGATTD